MDLLKTKSLRSYHFNGSDNSLKGLLPNWSEDLLSYGVEFDTTNSSPMLTRIGNSDLHRSLPIHSLMRGCLIDDTGKVVKYLEPSSWEAEVRDGSLGQVMVEIPEHYEKFETEGTRCRVKFSMFDIPGFHKVKKFYVSAYEASLQRSTLKLASVKNTSTDYRGGNNNAEYDDTYRSFLGRPVTSTSRINFRKYARNRNLASTEWNALTYEAYKTIFWLYYIEYANRNCQLPVNSEKDVNGFAQGGIGNGVTDFSSSTWSEFNGYNPFVPCGVSDSLGNSSGEVAYDIIGADNSVIKTVKVPRYRGIENPFGHIWKWVDGVNVQIEPGEDGKSYVWVCKDPSKFSDTGYQDYDKVGEEARTSGYVKNIIFGEHGDVVASEVGGGTTTGWCDYHYTSLPTSAASLRGLLFGGHAHHGAIAGFAFSLSNNVPSNSYAYVGSRLCFIPR